MALVTIFCSSAVAQSTSSDSEIQASSEVDFNIELPSHIRVLAFTGMDQGLDFPYRQSYASAALGYLFKPIVKSHVRNIDPDKEHYLVFGGGYEFLQTVQSGKVESENRVTIEATPGFRFAEEILLRDRNWIEMRWIDGAYSTTYRNELTVEREFLVRGLRFSPYVSVEFFYGGANHSRNQEWYTAGVEWPYKRLLRFDTYYRRENCNSCKPGIWNVTGVTLNFYFQRRN